MQLPKRSDISSEELHRILEYDPITGYFTWKVRTSNLRVGDRAGSNGVGVYRQIRIAGNCYLASRLAWLYMTGEWPEDEIDHKDTNRSNDAWGNLRPATTIQNLANRSRGRNNKSGYKGVSWSEKKKWRAVIGIDNKMVHLGYFDDPKLAHDAYMAAATAAWGEYARGI